VGDVQQQTEVFHYELVDEEGEPIGDLAHESNDLDVGDIVPCGGHVFEVREVYDTVLYVRRVL
jgi:hypothetical protein